jgi:hypothetical protein
MLGLTVFGPAPMSIANPEGAMMLSGRECAETICSFLRGTGYLLLSWVINMRSYLCMLLHHRPRCRRMSERHPRSPTLVCQPLFGQTA